jgi:hypothetical protein
VSATASERMVRPVFESHIASSTDGNRPDQPICFGRSAGA